MSFRTANLKLHIHSVEDPSNTSTVPFTHEYFTYVIHAYYPNQLPASNRLGFTWSSPPSSTHHPVRHPKPGFFPRRMKNPEKIYSLETPTAASPKLTPYGLTWRTIIEVSMVDMPLEWLDR